MSKITKTIEIFDENNKLIHQYGSIYSQSSNEIIEEVENAELRQLIADGILSSANAREYTISGILDHLKETLTHVVMHGYSPYFLSNCTLQIKTEGQIRTTLNMAKGTDSIENIKASLKYAIQAMEDCKPRPSFNELVTASVKSLRI
jgi:hypothetical protein